MTVLFIFFFIDIIKINEGYELHRAIKEIFSIYPITGDRFFPDIKSKGKYLQGFDLIQMNYSTLLTRLSLIESSKRKLKSSQILKMNIILLMLLITLLVLGLLIIELI